VDVLREMVQFGTQRLMEVEVNTLCGAGYDEKNPAERLNSRNGYRDRSWETRAGMVELRVPKLLKRTRFACASMVRLAFLLLPLAPRQMRSQS
jgi:putative transposase